jgi:hypothetical protein
MNVKMENLKKHATEVSLSSFLFNSSLLNIKQATGPTQFMQFTKSH